MNNVGSSNINSGARSSIYNKLDNKTFKSVDDSVYSQVECKILDFIDEEVSDILLDVVQPLKDEFDG